MICKEAEGEADGLKQIMAVKQEVEEPLFSTFSSGSTVCPSIW